MGPTAGWHGDVWQPGGLDLAAREGLQAGTAALCAWRWPPTTGGHQQPRPHVSALAFGGGAGTKVGRGCLCYALCHPCPLGKFLCSSPASCLPALVLTPTTPSIHGVTCSPVRSCPHLGHPGCLLDPHRAAGTASVQITFSWILWRLESGQL